MKYVLFLLPFALCACTTDAKLSAGASVADAVGVPAPATYANTTVLDERAMIALELAYKAARIAAEMGVDTGLIKGSTAARVATLDNQAYQALGVVRAAYQTGNSANYVSALASAQQAIADLLTLTGRSN